MKNNKDKEINLSEIDANFVISSFKNKERRNNPSAIPRALVPEYTNTQQEAESQEQSDMVSTNIPFEDIKRKRSKLSSYETLFLVNSSIPTRSGKLVSIREKYHDRIAKIVQIIGKKEVSIFSYIDNVLTYHFEQFRKEISELYIKNNEDDYLIPPK